MLQISRIPEILKQQKVDIMAWNNWVDLRPLETLVDGDATLVLNLVECYLDLFPKYMDEMNVAIELSHWDDCKRLAKQMKPLTVIVRVRQLFDLLHEIESTPDLEAKASKRIFKELSQTNKSVTRDLYATYARLQIEMN